MDDYSKFRRNRMNKRSSLVVDSLKTISTIVVVIAVIGVCVFGPASCVDETSTRRVLSEQGYTNIQITGYRYFMKGQGDVYCTGFEATSPNGSRVSGAVTSGWTKGSTIRFD